MNINSQRCHQDDMIHQNTATLTTFGHILHTGWSCGHTVDTFKFSWMLLTDYEDIHDTVIMMQCNAMNFSLLLHSYNCKVAGYTSHLKTMSTVHHWSTLYIPQLNYQDHIFRQSQGFYQSVSVRILLATEQRKLFLHLNLITVSE